MDAGTRRALVMLAVTAAVLIVLAIIRAPMIATPAAPEAATSRDRWRAKELAFSPAVAPSDRAWVLAAIAAARPEARALIDEVDGAVEVRTHRGLPIGVTRLGQGEGERRPVQISLDTTLLNGERRLDREVVMLHELGHVVDFLLVDQKVNDTLEAGIPRTGTCLRTEHGAAGSCAEPPERFADTFAKWALRGRVSAVGAGYGIASPPSLEAWGAPLGVMSSTLGRE